MQHFFFEVSFSKKSTLKIETSKKKYYINFILLSRIFFILSRKITLCLIVLQLTLHPR